MFNNKMNEIIKKAIQLDIFNIETKDGYNKADILVISSYNENHINMIKSFADLVTKETKLFKDKSTIYNEQQSDIYTLFSIFSDDKIDNDIYELK